MKKTKKIIVTINENGGITLPEELRQQFGLLAGDNIEIHLSENCFEIPRPIHRLAKVYIEPTNTCNLECRTCMRNVWQERNGFLSMDTFERIIESIRSIRPTPSVFFGGIGEPLAHPKISEMVDLAKSIGANVELITNGIYLTESVSKWMIETRLDRLWVSIDGVKRESYADVRLGDELQKIINNLIQLKGLKERLSNRFPFSPSLGIAFVAMKRNFQDLPGVVKLGKDLGADCFSISNVLPYTEELRSQTLYSRSLYITDHYQSEYSPIIAIPRFDLNEEIMRIITETFKEHSIAQFYDKSVDLPTNSCPFIKKGSMSIRWDGNVSPCLSLLHAHTSYLDDTLRKSKEYFVGNVNERPLLNIWNEPEYFEFRERHLTFDFSPCTFCNSCGMAESNLEDCLGNVHPTCGGCLWAQGFIQCP